MSRFPSPRYSRRKSSGSRFYDSRNRIRGHALTEATKRGILVSFNNRRSELAAATIGANQFDYAFDTIGNRNVESANAATNAYAANCLNQYTAIEGGASPPGEPPLCGSAPLREFQYDADGNLLRDGLFRYAYDAENRMIRATSLGQTNGALRVLNSYDHKHRRTRKTVQRFNIPSVAPPTPPPDGEWITTETHTYVWDDSNIVLERVAFTNGAARTCEYFWGPDLSGTEQGAGGVGGLLAVSIDGAYHLPCYDHNGNIVRYIAEDGTTSASYTYDPYGNVIDSYGNLADVFSFGFSTKYYDRETGMVGYKRRFHRPDLGRWLNRDPIEEEGGENLYEFCDNNPVKCFDAFGKWAVSIGISLDFGGSSGMSFSLSVGISFSRKKGLSIGIVRSGSIGSYIGVGASADVSVSISPTAPSVSDLKGLSTTIGGSGGEGVVFGASVSVPIDAESGYATYNASAGIGIGSPAEGHVFISQTLVSSWCLSGGRKSAESLHSVESIKPINESKDK